MGLWGPAWGTAGVVACSVTVDERGRWLSFPFETGLGEGTGVLEWTDEGARLPLGSRDGEHDMVLTRTLGALGAAARREASDSASERIGVWQAAWSSGVFRLQVDERLVGEVQFEGAGQVSVATYDAHWMTEGLVRAALAPHGPDLALQFPVMPALQEEDGLLLVNVPTGQVVVPAAAEPTPLDRWLALVPGTVGDEEAVMATRAATDAGLAREREVLEALLPGLAASADAACVGDGGRPELLPGYTVRGEPTESGCALVVEPEPVQHGRRMAVRVQSDGQASWLVRSLP